MNEFGFGSSGTSGEREIKREGLSPQRFSQRRRSLLACLVLLVFAMHGLVTDHIAFAQAGRAISGYVTDVENGAPLPGANVQVLGTVLGASTDAEGRFVLNGLPAGRLSLRISFIGYAAVEERVDGAGAVTLEIALRPTAIAFDQVVVTGSRQGEELRAAANSLDVVGRRSLLKKNTFRIDDVLRDVPGVNRIGENISVRGSTGYSLLGVGGSRVLMLIDEVPVLTSDLGRANWDILPVTEVERVEVLRGAGSVLYGSGGVSGVINIITRRAGRNARFDVRHSTGLYSAPSVPEWKWTDRRLHFYRTDVGFGKKFGSVGVRAAVSRHYSTSDRQNGDFGRWYLMLKPTVQFGDGSNLSFLFSYNNDKRGFFFQWREQNRALETNFADRINVDGIIASAAYTKPFSQRLMLKTRLSFNSQLIGLPFNLTNNFEPAVGLGGDFQVFWLPAEAHQLTIGADARQDRAEAVYYGRQRGRMLSPYVQETWRIAPWARLSAGARYDTYVLVGDSAEVQWSPKLGLSIEPLDGTVLHASWGRGFRAPTIAERFSASQPGDNVRLLNNPGLRPERSSLLDFGVRQKAGRYVSAELTAFFNRYTDLIELTQISDLTLELQFRNCPGARISGIEGQVHAALWERRLQLRANYTWLHSRAASGDRFCNFIDGKALPYRPEHSLYISPEMQLGGWRIGADVLYVSRFDAVSFFPRDERVAQKLVHLRVAHEWRAFTILAQVRNLFNHNHTVVEQNLGEIRNVSLSLSTSF